MAKFFPTLLVLASVFSFSSCRSSAGESSSSQSGDEPTVSLLEGENLASEYIDWYGRHRGLNNKEYFYYTATGFMVNFFGRIIDIELELENRRNDIYYSVAKDGEDLLDGMIYVQTKNQTLRITFETYSHHTIEMVKRSEPEDGITSLKKISTNGYFMKKEPMEKIPWHFLLIGASGISGHGALGAPNQIRTTANSSSLHSFGYLTAAIFQGTYEFVSNSGWGIKYGFNDTTGNINLVGAYEKIGLDANQKYIDVTYNHNKKSDVIIVNAGGNDYSAVINKSSGFEKSEKIKAFQAQVAQFVLKLRHDHPDAHIFWTKTSGSFNGAAALEIINQLEEGDRSMVHVVDIEDVGSNGDLAGADSHASYITHQRSAANLAIEIHKYLEA